MPINEPLTAINDEPCKVEPVTCNCDFFWSQAHQFCYLRLSDKIGTNEYQLVDLYAARAKRIAATYARFYLETEEGGDSSKIGRYYWMALGAFASKTVACLLDAWQLKTSYFFRMTDIANGLAKGNLWLFTDIAASHWFYNNHPEDFRQGMACEKKRHASRLEKAVKTVTYDLPWAHESIRKVKEFAPSSDIVEAFDWVKKIEETSDERKLPGYRMKQLLAVAEHEQGAVLQPLIYDDPDFTYWTKKEREWFRFLAPKYQLVFGHQCEVNDPDLKSEAPDDLVVENFDSRMDWITDAADTFHGLMTKRKSYMIQELKTIAGWDKTPDAPFVY